VVVAIVATAGVAAVPLAGTALGAILMSAAVGAAIGAVTDAAVYTGITLATGGQWSLEGMAGAAAIGALVGGVTAGAGKAFSLWRAAALAGRAGALAADGGERLAPRILVRVFGGKSPPAGRSWTTPLEFVKGFMRPGGVRNYLGIGSWNTGEGLAVGFTRRGATAVVRNAFGAEGLEGGGLEILADPSIFGLIWKLPLMGTV
jgi:hypothetical protein